VALSCNHLQSVAISCNQRSSAAITHPDLERVHHAERHRAHFGRVEHLPNLEGSSVASQWYSKQRPSEATRGHQRPPAALTEAISMHSQRPSACTHRGHQHALTSLSTAHQWRRVLELMRDAISHQRPSACTHLVVDRPPVAKGPRANEGRNQPSEAISMHSPRCRPPTSGGGSSS